MIVELSGVRLLTDPGNYTAEAQESVTNIQGVLITHEHQDHLHLDSLKVILEKNPTAVVVGNSAVARIVKDTLPQCSLVVVGDGESTNVAGVSIKGFGEDHEPIYKLFGLVENTGYVVAEKFYFPGDAFHLPVGKAGNRVPVDILALPIAGPWMKVGQAIDFARELKPRVAFGVHDGMMKQGFNFGARMAPTLLKDSDVEFVHLSEGETREF